MGDVIRGFQGRYRFLSNFYPFPVGFECLNAREARRLGREIQIRPGWVEDKLNVMYRVLRAKFSVGLMRSKLSETGDAYLEEVNYWHDTFWGVYNGQGENHLGRLLMVVRDEIREGII